MWRSSVRAAHDECKYAELKIWIGSDPNPLMKKFSKKVNIYDVQKVLAAHTLK